MRPSFWQAITHVLKVLQSLALQDHIAPPAVAKIILEPHVVLSSVFGSSSRWVYEELSIPLYQKRARVNLHVPGNFL